MFISYSIILSTQVSFHATHFWKSAETTTDFIARNLQAPFLYAESWTVNMRDETRKINVILHLIKKILQSCKVSLVSCLMILNQFLWLYYSPAPLYFSQILLQAIRHWFWPKFFLLLIVFRCPVYSVAKIKYECVRNKTVHKPSV